MTSIRPPDDSRGLAGASALREYDRRRGRRENRARARFGTLGVAAVRLLGDPQSTRAWKQGADGEQLAGAELERHLRKHPVVLLHDRKLTRGGRANIDHLAIGPGGVTVIDTKSTKGRLELTRTGGLLSPRRELLLINGRDRTTLLDKLERQIAAVTHTLDNVDADVHVEVRGALCYPNIDGLPLLGQLTTRRGTLTIDDPRGIAKLARRPGPLTPTDVELLARELSQHLPAA